MTGNYLNSKRFCQCINCRHLMKQSQLSNMEKITLMLFLFWCCPKNFVEPFSDLSNNETTMYQYRTKLYEKMLKTYDKRILPQCTEDPVDVTIELAPKEIVNVQENQESAKFQLWVRLSWFDCNLVWNKSTHGNISSITVPNDDRHMDS